MDTKWAEELINSRGACPSTLLGTCDAQVIYYNALRNSCVGGMVSQGRLTSAADKKEESKPNKSKLLLTIKPRGINK